MVRTVIGGVEVDALIEETQNYSADVPDYPVEDGFSVSDNIVFKANSLNIQVVVTDTPVTYNEGRGLGTRSIKKVEELEEMWHQKKPITIQTTTKTYKNYVITSFVVSHGKGMGYSREIQIQASEIRTTETKTVEVSPEIKIASSTQNLGNAEKKEMKPNKPADRFNNRKAGGNAKTMERIVMKEHHVIA